MLVTLNIHRQKIKTDPISHFVQTQQTQILLQTKDMYVQPEGIRI